MNITEERQYSVAEIENGVRVSLLGSGIVIDSVYLNGEAEESLSGSRELLLMRSDSSKEYTVYTLNTVTGETDCARISLCALSEGTDETPPSEIPDTPPSQHEDDGKLSFGTAVLITVLTSLAAIGGCAAFIVVLFRRKDKAGRR